jgi:hypothetical protein
MPWRRVFYEPGVYSFWVHFVMVTLVGCTMIAMGLFLSWRVQRTHETLRDVESHLKQHDALGAEIVQQQQQILDRLR